MKRASLGAHPRQTGRQQLDPMSLDPLGCPGWFFTSTADQVYYYFLAILNTTAELRPLYAEYLELVRAQRPTPGLDEKLLRSLKIDRDLLITYPLDKARAWYETASRD